MNEFQLYINNLLKKTKLPRSEKSDLEKELIEHLNNLKYDYLKNGLSEKEAIDKVIENFNSSNFLNEINNFSKKEKLSNLSIKFILKTNLILILIYTLLMIIGLTLLKINIKSNILYFFIICFVSFFNYYYSSSNLIQKKDISLNISITCCSFFLLEKIGIIILSKIYILLTNNIESNIWSLYSFDINKILIYIFLSIIIFSISKLNKNSIPKINTKLNDFDIFILISSVILNLIYFLYPNRFYFLRLIISKIFKFEINFFSKNLFYMTINNEIFIINIGLLLFILFISYKLIRYIRNNLLKENK